MGLHRHPHLVHGTVHTPRGAFVVSRGLLDVPDEIGALYGWEPVVPDAQADEAEQARPVRVLVAKSQRA